jgi:hypothetical protein
VPVPAERVALAVDRVYDADEFARIALGHDPCEMEEKWIAFYEEPRLFLHRSWTGQGVYEVRFEPVDGGMRVAEAWTGRNADAPFGDPAGALILGILLDAYAGRDVQEAWRRLLPLLTGGK